MFLRKRSDSFSRLLDHSLSLICSSLLCLFRDISSLCLFFRLTNFPHPSASAGSVPPLFSFFLLLRIAICSVLVAFGIFYRPFVFPDAHLFLNVNLYHLSIVIPKFVYLISLPAPVLY